MYAVSFTALGQAGPGIRAHHMILSKCRKPKKVKFGETWDCQHHAMCNDQSKIMFAWAKHAQPTQLPEDVGFPLEPEDYLVLQVHYAKPQVDDHSGLAIAVRREAPKYTAGMFLLLRSQLSIPPNTPAVHGDVNCQANLRCLTPSQHVTPSPGPQSTCSLTARTPTASAPSSPATGAPATH